MNKDADFLHLKIVLSLLLLMLLQLSSHSVALVLTLVGPKQIRLNMYKRSNMYTVQTTQKTANTNTHIT
jgi:hypothetical protein